jgi:hypothetical protein
MDWKIVVAAPLVAWMVVANGADIRMPADWSNASHSSSGDAFLMGVDPAMTYNGQRSLVVRTTMDSADVDYGAAIQYVDAKGYEGRRVRFSGMLKTRGVTTWAGVFMLASKDHTEDFWGSSPKSTDLLPRGSESQPGDSDWRPVSVVFAVPDVPNQMLSMGIVLIGNGQAWLSDLRFEEVGNEVPVTVAPIGLDMAKLAARQQHHKDQEAHALAAAQSRQVPANLGLNP